jgi:hypothetical protein
VTDLEEADKQVNDKANKSAACRRVEVVRDLPGDRTDSRL